jgi:RNA polymerase sigma-70 factor, ECF subfamily
MALGFYIGETQLGAYMRLPDQQVIKLAARGDRSAQEQVYYALCDRVHRVISRIVGSSDADDVTQDFFVNLFSKLHTFKFDSSFLTWAHRVAVNDALQHLRRSRNKVTVPLEESSVSDRKVGPVLDFKELFDAAFSKLEGSLQLILELKEVEQLSYGEIAQALDIPEGTVGSRLNRARRDLKANLSELGWK